jgi:PTH2 family peptidyl-tRNA hydrolase
VTPRLPRSGPEPTEKPELRILVNGDVTMSRGKACAQAVHAALEAFGVPHGRVVVLTGSRSEVAAMDVVIYDAGLTEIEPGTMTAGATMIG